MAGSTGGAQFEILVDGKSRSWRDSRVTRCSSRRRQPLAPMPATSTSRSGTCARSTRAPKSVPIHASSSRFAGGGSPTSWLLILPDWIRTCHASSTSSCGKTTASVRGRAFCLYAARGRRGSLAAVPFAAAAAVYVSRAPRNVNRYAAECDRESRDRRPPLAPRFLQQAL